MGDPCPHVPRPDRGLTRRGGDAITQLASLTTSPRPALAHAGRRDIAFVIASETDTDAAYCLLARLARGPAGADLEILDTVSAALLELGNDVMGGQVNERALDCTAPSLPGPRCQRLARRIALHGRVDRAGAVGQFIAGPWPAEVRWQQLVRVRGCDADPHTRCQDHFADTGVDARYFDLLFADHAWRDPVLPWREIGTRALLAAGLDGAELMSARALEAALMRTWCAGDEARELREPAWRLEVAARGRPDLPAAERAEIEAITDRLADRAGPRCRHRPPRTIEWQPAARCRRQRSEPRSSAIPASRTNRGSQRLSKRVIGRAWCRRSAW